MIGAHHSIQDFGVDLSEGPNDRRYRVVRRRRTDSSTEIVKRLWSWSNSDLFLVEPCFVVQTSQPGGEFPKEALQTALQTLTLPESS